MKKNIKYIKFVVAISLFFFGSLFKYIPMLIFKINENGKTLKESTTLAGTSSISNPAPRAGQ